MSQHIAVLGAGGWGTALGNLLAKKGHDVVVWSFEGDVAQSINDAHENPRYLPAVHLNAKMRATADVQAAVTGATAVVSVTPAQHVREVLSEAAEAIRDDALIIS